MPLLCLLHIAHAKSLVVHEWGTFTAVAGPDGEAVVWKPLTGEDDLPDFVYTWEEHLEGRRVQPPCLNKGCGGRVRMETPVIYFHVDEPMTVEVDVTFPEGTLTEWYPKADIPAVSGLHWGRFKVDPGLSPSAFPHDGSDSHYYPARETTAAPVQVCDTQGVETERFLFYRGVGDFPLSLNVRLQDGVRVEGPRGHILVFENDGEQLAWQGVDHRGVTTVPRDMPAGSKEELLAELQGWLVDEGLYEDEAWAMVRTWEDSWFEPGLRVLYVLPDREVDDILPLTVSPRPDEVERVLVGRVEVITPEMQADARAIGGNASALVDTFGRFAEPVAASLSWNDPDS